MIYGTPQLIDGVLYQLYEGDMICGAPYFDKN